MKRFALMHMGFERPTPDDMAKWREWFVSIADATVENIGFAGGCELTREGVRDLGWDGDCITGLTIIEAESLDAAQAVAEGCPFTGAIRVYEMRGREGAGPAAGIHPQLTTS